MATDVLDITALFDEVVGSYRMIRCLGEGGMGAVYLARHPELGSEVAIKVLRPEHSRNVEVIRRCFDEAYALAQLQHPGIVRIYDFGHHTNGMAYLVMELLQGEPLAARMKREGPLPEAVVMEVMRQLASVLDVIHQVGVVHRDLRPRNLYLTLDEQSSSGSRVKVLELGLAKLAARDEGSNTAPVYMSPEQCRDGARIDHRSDLYSLGCIAFEMACGGPPFARGGSPFEVAMQHIAQPAERLRDRGAAVNAALEEIVARLLEKDPAERYQSAEQLLAALERAVSARAPTAPRRKSVSSIPPPTSSSDGGGRKPPDDD
jgi:eukaryotic-like serine/threonine-protein kinase